jgi:hypothetical protein
VRRLEQLGGSEGGDGGGWAGAGGGEWLPTGGRKTRAGLRVGQMRQLVAAQPWRLQGRQHGDPPPPSTALPPTHLL